MKNAFYTEHQQKEDKDLRGKTAPGEAASAGHNGFMGKEANAARHNFVRKDCLISIGVQYNKLF